MGSCQTLKWNSDGNLNLGCHSYGDFALATRKNSIRKCNFFELTTPRTLFIVTKYSSAAPHCAWTAHSWDLVRIIIGALFCLVRLSNLAVEHGKWLRGNISMILKEDKSTFWELIIMHAYNTNSEHLIDDPNGASVIVLDYNTNRYEHVADSFDDVNEDVSCRLLIVRSKN